jgi:hypothetical protein
VDPKLEMEDLEEQLDLIFTKPSESMKKILSHLNAAKLDELKNKLMAARDAIKKNGMRQAAKDKNVKWLLSLQWAEYRDQLRRYLDPVLSGDTVLDAVRFLRVAFT